MILLPLVLEADGVPELRIGLGEKVGSEHGGF
jgi:hypothetical protein